MPEMPKLSDQDDSTLKDDGLLLISWNVAGWASTQLLVRRHYGGMEQYLKRMGNPAVFCIQETKVQGKSLKTEAAGKELGAIIPGYRSFWALNEDKDPKRAHLQGVATWVRNDVEVLGATQRVFGESSLNEQGRALLTDHGTFAVLNVYVPFVGMNGTEQEAARKLKFLQELERVMAELKAHGKRVILCGDVNLTHRATDQKPHRRVLWVDENGHIAASLPSSVQVGSVDGSAEGGKEISTPQRDQKPHKPDDPVRSMTLGPFSDWANRWIPVKDVADRTSIPAGALAIGGECLHMAEEGCVAWLRKVVTPEGVAPWADVFAEVHSTAVDRFTAWGQGANLRYRNFGTRIDYVICDRSTFECAVLRSASHKLPGGISGKGDEEEVLSTSAEAASHAATHFNGWHAAAGFGIAQGDGLSLQVDDMRLNDTQFSEPYTGLVYTPPSYSDHIAVSVLFDQKLLSPLTPLSTSARQPWKASLESHMKQTQPWRGQPSIAAFFGGGAKRPAPGQSAPKKSQKI